MQEFSSAVKFRKSVGINYRTFSALAERATKEGIPFAYQVGKKIFVDLSAWRLFLAKHPVGGAK